jgi:hypothetical protein
VAATPVATNTRKKTKTKQSKIIKESWSRDGTWTALTITGAGGRYIDSSDFEFSKSCSPQVGALIISTHKNKKWRAFLFGVFFPHHIAPVRVKTRSVVLYVDSREQQFFFSIAFITTPYYCDHN